MWERINRAFDLLDGQRAIVLAAVGCCLCRLSVSWVFILARGGSWGFADSIDMHLVVDAGEILAYLALMPVALRVAPFARRALLFLGPAVSYLLAFAGLLTIGGLDVSASVGGTIASVACFALLGYGYVNLLLLWCEHFGVLAPKNVLVVLALSELMRNIIWFGLGGVTFELGCVLCVALCVASSLMLVSCHRLSPLDGLALRLPSLRETPIRVIVWCAAFSFAYGLGDSITGMALTTIPHTMGMMALILLVLVGLAQFPDAFDLGVLRKASLVFMAVGLFAAFFDGLGAIAQVLMSAADLAVYLFILTAACGFARRHGKSPIYSCGLLLASRMVFARIGTTVGTLAQVPDGSGRYLLLAVFALLVVVGSLVFRDRDVFAQPAPVAMDAPASPGAAHAADLAKRYSLTAKETEVLELLLAGDAVADIAEALFIAPSTVRVHIARIYKKCSTHSREELLLLADAVSIR